MYKRILYCLIPVCTKETEIKYQNATDGGRTLRNEESMICRIFAILHFTTLQKC